MFGSAKVHFILFLISDGRTSGHFVNIVSLIWVIDLGVLVPTGLYIGTSSNDWVTGVKEYLHEKYLERANLRARFWTLSGKVA